MDARALPVKPTLPLVAICTTDGPGLASSAFRRLLASFGEVARFSPSSRLVLVLRGVEPHLGGAVESERPFVETVPLPGPAGLATARNAGLAHARGRGYLHARAVVAFPDDDAWYWPPAVFELLSLLEENPTLDFVGGSYSPEEGRVATARFSPRAGRFDVTTAVRSCSSVTVFVRGDAVAAVGDFDERFGKGTALGAGEDVDFVLRLLEAGGRGLYRPQAVIGHELGTGRRYEYYLGSVAVLGKHARCSGGVAVMTARALLAGLPAVLRRDLAWTTWWRAVALAVSFTAAGAGHRPDGRAASVAHA